MNDLVEFNFEGNEVRVVNHKDQEWFIADDIAKAIGHSNTTMMVKNVNDKYKTVVNVCDLSNSHIPLKNPYITSQSKKRSRARDTQDMTIISEPGVWQILARSRLPKVEKFQDWLFEEVLPSIRKTGSYSVNQDVAQLNTTQEMVLNSIIKMGNDWSQFIGLLNSSGLMDILKISKYSNLFEDYSKDAPLGDILKMIPEIKRTQEISIKQRREARHRKEMSEFCQRFEERLSNLERGGV